MSITNVSESNYRLIKSYVEATTPAVFINQGAEVSGKIVAINRYSGDTIKVAFQQYAGSFGFGVTITWGTSQIASMQEPLGQSINPGGGCYVDPVNFLPDDCVNQLANFSEPKLLCGQGIEGNVYIIDGNTAYLDISSNPLSTPITADDITIVADSSAPASNLPTVKFIQVIDTNTTRVHIDITDDDAIRGGLSIYGTIGPLSVHIPAGKLQISSGSASVPSDLSNTIRLLYHLHYIGSGDITLTLINPYGIEVIGNVLNEGPGFVDVSCNPLTKEITTTDFLVSENITLGEPQRLSDTLCRVPIFVAGDKANSSYNIVIPAHKLAFAGVEGHDSVVSFSLVKQKWNGLQVISNTPIGEAASYINNGTPNSLSNYVCANGVANGWQGIISSQSTCYTGTGTTGTVRYINWSDSSNQQNLYVEYDYKFQFSRHSDGTTWTKITPTAFRITSASGNFKVGDVLNYYSQTYNGNSGGLEEIQGIDALGKIQITEVGVGNTTTAGASNLISWTYSDYEIYLTDFVNNTKGLIWVDTQEFTIVVKSTSGTKFTLSTEDITIQNLDIVSILPNNTSAKQFEILVRAKAIGIFSFQTTLSSHTLRGVYSTVVLTSGISSTTPNVPVEFSISAQFDSQALSDPISAFSEDNIEVVQISFPDVVTFDIDSSEPKKIIGLLRIDNVTIGQPLLPTTADFEIANLADVIGTYYNKDEITGFGNIGYSSTSNSNALVKPGMFSPEYQYLNMALGNASTPSFSLPFAASEDEIVAHLSSKSLSCLIWVELPYEQRSRELPSHYSWIGIKNNDNNEGLTLLTNQEALNNEGVSYRILTKQTHPIGEVGEYTLTDWNVVGNDTTIATFNIAFANHAMYTVRAARNGEETNINTMSSSTVTVDVHDSLMDPSAVQFANSAALAQGITGLENQIVIGATQVNNVPLKRTQIVSEERETNYSDPALYGSNAFIVDQPSFRLVVFIGSNIESVDASSIVVNDISVVASGSIESDIAGMSMQYFDMLLDNNETIIDRPLVVEVKDASGNITGISNTIFLDHIVYNSSGVTPILAFTDITNGQLQTLADGEQFPLTRRGTVTTPFAFQSTHPVSEIVISGDIELITDKCQQINPRVYQISFTQNEPTESGVSYIQMPAAFFSYGGIEHNLTSEASNMITWYYETENGNVDGHDLSPIAVTLDVPGINNGSAGSQTLTGYLRLYLSTTSNVDCPENLYPNPYGEDYKIKLASSSNINASVITHSDNVIIRNWNKIEEDDNSTVFSFEAIVQDNSGVYLEVEKDAILYSITSPTQYVNLIDSIRQGSVWLYQGPSISLPPKSDSILPTTSGDMTAMSDTERAKYKVGTQYYMVVPYVYYNENSYFTYDSPSNLGGSACAARILFSLVAKDNDPNVFDISWQNISSFVDWTTDPTSASNKYYSANSLKGYSLIAMAPSPQPGYEWLPSLKEFYDDYNAKYNTRYGEDQARPRSGTTGWWPNNEGATPANSVNSIYSIGNPLSSKVEWQYDGDISQIDHFTIPIKMTTSVNAPWTFTIRSRTDVWSMDMSPDGKHLALMSGGSGDVPAKEAAEKGTNAGYRGGGWWISVYDINTNSITLSAPYATPTMSSATRNFWEPLAKVGYNTYETTSSIYPQYLKWMTNEILAIVTPSYNGSIGSAASSVRWPSNWSNNQYGTSYALSSTTGYGGIWLMAAGGTQSDQTNWNAGFNIAAPNAYWQTYAQSISYLNQGSSGYNPGLYSVQNSALAATITWPSLWIEAVANGIPAMWPDTNGNITNAALSLDGSSLSDLDLPSALKSTSMLYRTSSPPAGLGTAITCSPDGDLLVVGIEDGSSCYVLTYGMLKPSDPSVGGYGGFLPPSKVVGLTGGLQIGKTGKTSALSLAFESRKSTVLLAAYIDDGQFVRIDRYPTVGVSSLGKAKLGSFISGASIPQTINLKIVVSQLSDIAFLLIGETVPPQIVDLTSIGNSSGDVAILDNFPDVGVVDIGMLKKLFLTQFRSTDGSSYSALSSFSQVNGFSELLRTFDGTNATIAKTTDVIATIQDLIISVYNDFSSVIISPVVDISSLETLTVGNPPYEYPRIDKEQTSVLIRTSVPIFPALITTDVSHNSGVVIESTTANRDNNSFTTVISTRNLGKYQIFVPADTVISIDGTKNKDASNTFKWEFYIPPPVPTFDSVTLNHTGEKTTNYDQSFNVIVSGRWDTDFGPVNSLVLSDKLYLLDFMESPDVSNNWQFATRVYPYSSINDVPLANRQSSPTLVSDGNPVNNSTFGGGYWLSLNNYGQGSPAADGTYSISSTPDWIELDLINSQVIIGAKMSGVTEYALAADLRFVISDTSLITSDTPSDTQLLAATPVKSIRTSYQETNGRYPSTGEFNVIWTPTTGRYLYVIMDRAHYVNQKLEVTGFAAIMRGQGSTATLVTDCSMSIPSNTFEITRYNIKNTQSAEFDWKFVSVAPTVTISGVDISNNSWTKQESTTFNIAMDKADCSPPDLTKLGQKVFIDGVSASDANNLPLTFSNLTKIDDKNYTFVATHNSTNADDIYRYVIWAEPLLTTDAIGNGNFKTASFSWKYVNHAPTVTITSTDVSFGLVTSREQITVVCTPDEPITNIQPSSFIVTPAENVVITANSTRTTTVSSGSVTEYLFDVSYSAITESPKNLSIQLPSNSIIDFVGNVAVKGATFNWIYSNTRPTVQITSSDVALNGVTGKTSIQMKLICSERPLNFDSTKVVSSGIKGDELEFSNFVIPTTAPFDITFTATVVKANGLYINGEYGVYVAAEAYDDGGQDNNLSTAGVVLNTPGESDYKFIFELQRPTVTLTSETIPPTLSVEYGEHIVDIDLDGYTLTEDSNDAYIVGLLQPPTYPFEFPTGWRIATVNEVITSFPPDGISWGYETTIQMTNGTYGTVAANAISDNNVIRHTNDLNTLLESTGQWTGALWVTYPQSSGTLPTGWTIWTHPYGTIKGTDIKNVLPNTGNFGFQDLHLQVIEASGNTVDIASSKFKSFKIVEPGKKYQCTIVCDIPGSYNLSVPANSFADLAGNRNVASNILSWNFSVVAPSVTIVSRDGFVSGGQTNKESLPFTFQLSQPLAIDETFPWDSIEITGATDYYKGKSYQTTAVSQQSQNVLNYDFGINFRDISLNENVAFSIQLKEGALTNRFGLSSGKSNEITGTYTNIPPVVVISSPDISKRNQSRFSHVEIDVSLNEPVLSFTVADIIWGGDSDTILDLRATNDEKTTYKFSVLTSDSDEFTEYSVQIKAGLTDLAGNVSLASNVLTWKYNNIPINGTSTTSGVTDGETASKDTNIDVSFNIPVAINSGLIDVTGGTVTSIVQTGEGAYTIGVAATAPGDVSVIIPAAAITSMSGTQSSVPISTSWKYTKTPPAVKSITSSIEKGGGTSKKTLKFIVTLTEKHTTFSRSSIVLDPSADIYMPAGDEGFVQGADSDVYHVTIKSNSITNLIQQRSLTIPPASFKNVVDIENVDSSVFPWTFSDDAPDLTYSSPDVAAGGFTRKSTITIVISSPLDSSTFSVNNIACEPSGTISNFKRVVRTSHTDDYHWSFDVETPTEGLFTVDVPAGNFVDVYGVVNLDNQHKFSWHYSDLPPVISITSPDVRSEFDTGYTSASSIQLIFSVSEPVSATDAFDYDKIYDITSEYYGITTPFDFLGVSGESYLFSTHLTINHATDGNQYSFILPVGTVTDLVGLKNTQDFVFTWYYYDEANIRLQFNSLVGEPITKEEKVTIRVTSQQPMLGLTPDKFTIRSNYADQITITPANIIPNSASSFTYHTTRDQIFLFDVSIDPSGALETADIGILILPDVLTTPTGMKNSQSNLLQWTYTNEPPSGTASSPEVNSVTNDTNHSKITINFTFNKRIKYGSFSTESFVKHIVSDGRGITLSNFHESEYTISTDAEVLGNGTYVLSIPVDSVSDLVGNKNTKPVIFEWNYSDTPPNCTLASTTLPASLRTNVRKQRFSLTFTEPLKESPAPTTESLSVSSNITVLDMIRVNSTTYSSNLITNSNGESSVTVKADAAEDLFSNKSLVSNTISWFFSDAPPVLTITSPDITNGISLNTHIVITIDASEEVVSLNASSLKGTGFTITGIKRITPSEFTATIFTPDPGNYELTIDAGTVSDLQGNVNAVDSTLEWLYEGAAPKCTSFSSDAIRNVNGTNIVTSQRELFITAQFSETIKPLSISSFITSGATIKSVVSDSSNNTSFIIGVAFDVDIGIDQTVSVTLPGQNYENLWGRQGSTDVSLSWLYDPRPFVEIEPDNPQYCNIYIGTSSVVVDVFVGGKGDNIVEHTFTLSEGSSITDLTKVKEGHYKLTLYTPKTGAYTLSVPENTFRDAYGNLNTASNLFNWYYALNNSDEEMVIYAESVGCNPGCIGIPPSCPPRVFYKPIETAGVRPILGNTTTRVQYIGIASRAPGRTRRVITSQNVNIYGSRAGAPGGSGASLRNSFS